MNTSKDLHWFVFKFYFFLVKVIRNVQEQATQDLVIGGFKVKDKQNIMAQPCCGVKYYIK